MEFLFATQNLAFTVALVLLALLVLVELGIGGGLSGYFDTLLPNLEIEPMARRATQTGAQD